MTAQQSLLGLGEPSFDRRFSLLRRHELSSGAWVDHQAGWLDGHQSLFDALVDGVTWKHQRRPMYDRMVDVPRLIGEIDAPESHDTGFHDTGFHDTGSHDDGIGIVGEMARTLSERYDTELDRVGVALYRDGRDSVAWHGDQVARELPQALVATVSLGEPRKFRLRPRDGGSGLAFQLGHGDLVVMGGTCQRTWEHTVPKVARAGPRIALMFRPVWELPG